MVINSYTDWERVQCFGHRLHLAVRKALKGQDEAIKPALAAMKKVIGHFAHSHKKRRKLKEAQVKDSGLRFAVG